MSRANVWLGIGAAALLGSALFAMAKVSAKGPDWRISQTFGGSTSIECLRDPQTVEIYEMDASRPPAEGETSIGGVAVKGPARRADAAAAAALRDLLLADASYEWWRVRNDVRFRSDLGLRFVRDASRLDLLVSTDAAFVKSFRMGKMTGFADVGPSRDALLAIVRSAGWTGSPAEPQPPR